MKLIPAPVVALVMTGIAGCQSYQPLPLDLREHAAQWTSRSLAVESIASYAAALAQSTGAQEPFDSSDGLSLVEAEAVALHFNAGLRLARAVAEVPLASAQEAGWWPDPKFEAEILRFVDRGDRTRFKGDGPSIDGINASGLEISPVGLRRVRGDYIEDPWIVGAGLSITIPLSGRLAVDKELRWSQYSAAWRRILVREWELITELRAAWLAWSSSVERLRITRDYVDRLETIASMTQRLVEAGEMKPTEGRLLQIELARRKTSLLLMEGGERQARLAVFSLMGLSCNAAIALEPELSMAAISVPPESHAALLLEHHPQIKLVDAEYEAAEQQLRLEIRRQYPDLDIGPSFSFEEGFTRLGLGIGFPIPLWNRNRQGIAEALAARQAARVQAEAVVEGLLSELARVEIRLKYASQRRKTLLDSVAPLVDKQVEESRMLLSLGEIDVLLLRDALTGSLDTKLELLEATLAEGGAANEFQQMLQPRWSASPRANLEDKDR